MKWKLLFRVRNIGYNIQNLLQGHLSELNRHYNSLKPFQLANRQMLCCCTRVQPLKNQGSGFRGGLISRLKAQFFELEKGRHEKKSRFLAGSVVTLHAV